MGKFWNRIDVKKASKTTYSEDDLRKQEMNFSREFQSSKGPRIYTPFRKENPRVLQTQIREQVFESILDKHLYTFQHLLVIPNPYDVAPQTALLLFNTSKSCSVRYRVLGHTGDADFVGETSLGMRHRVPVMGLYQAETNKLRLELLDEQHRVIKRRELTIYARALPEKMMRLVTRTVHREESQFPFLLINGLRFQPFVLDQNGEVRYSLRLKTNNLGMIPLQNGHFLYADSTVNLAGQRGEIQTCQYHEIDYMGRIYRTFLLEYPIRRAIAQNGDSLFLVTSSSEKYIGDTIIEVDRNSGRIVKQCNLAEIVGTEHRNRKNWIPVTHMEFRQGMLLLTLKRFHTVLQLCWEDLSVQWVIAPPAVWKGTALSSYVLEQERGEEFSLLPEYAAYQEERKILIYSIQNKGGLPVEGASDSKKSRVTLCEIFPEKKRCRYLEKIPAPKASNFAKAIHGEGRLLVAAGLLAERTENRKSTIVEVAASDGSVINRFNLRRAFGNIWRFQPDITSYGEPLEKNMDVFLGKLPPPERFTGVLPPLSEEKMEKRYFGKIRLCGSLFLYKFYPGMIQRVYLVGEKGAYVQDYSHLTAGNRRYSFVTALNQLDYDEYQVYVEYDGNVYRLKNEIRIERRKDKQG